MKMEDGKITIHPGDIVDGLSKEDKIELLKSYIIDTDVIQSVLDYICDEDEHGWWTGDSDEIRASFLKRVEDTHLAQFSRYNWKSLGLACDKIKKIRSEQHLYWKLYHAPQSHEITIAEWLRKNNIKDDISEHTTKIADDEIEEIIKTLKEEINGLQPLNNLTQ